MSSTQISGPNQAPMFVAIVSAFLGLAVISGIVRLYTRIRIIKWVGRDDVLILFAVLAAVAQTMGGIIGSSFSEIFDETF
jgi:hypothetical protein